MDIAAEEVFRHGSHTGKSFELRFTSFAAFLNIRIFSSQTLYHDAEDDRRRSQSMPSGRVSDIWKYLGGRNMQV